MVVQEDRRDAVMAQRISGRSFSWKREASYPLLEVCDKNDHGFWLSEKSQIRRNAKTSDLLLATYFAVAFCLWPKSPRSNPSNDKSSSKSAQCNP
jgi:hypothetical protein